MNSFEARNDETRIENFSRRNFMHALCATGIALVAGGREVFGQELPSRYGEESGGWFRSSKEMRDTYDKEYNGEKILKNCFQVRENKIIGTINGEEFEVPDKFVNSILSHLQQMMEAGALRYIFRLDAFHGHPFLSTEILKSRYDITALKEVDDIKITVSDDDVKILYHNSEHLNTEDADDASRAVHSKRNVIGSMDNQSLNFLPIPTETPRTAVSTPEGSTDLQSSLKFAAHKDGAFTMRVGDTEIRLDLSLDDNTYY